MMVSFHQLTLLFASLLSSHVFAQQYAGDVIPNKLPVIPGAELAYFRITDPAQKSHHLTLTNQYSLQKSGAKLDPKALQRAVIVIHGKWRDAHESMNDVLGAMAQETDPNINSSSVAIIAPYFFDGADRGKGFPYAATNPVTGEKGLTGSRRSWSNALVWKGSQWAGGGMNQYPHGHRTISTYEVLDQLVKYFNDKSIFPNIKQIVVAGHSLGGQTVQRYAVVGRTAAELGVSTPVTHFLANPDSFVWLNSSRPADTSKCPSYNVWRNGLSNYTQYPNTYNTRLVVDGGYPAVLANFATKSKAYAHGIRDFGDASEDCGAATTGINRSVRFYNFLAWWPARKCGKVGALCDTVDLVETGHHSSIMFASEAGRARLFEDNFYGNGKKKADFGWPVVSSSSSSSVVVKTTSKSTSTSVKPTTTSTKPTSTSSKPTISSKPTTSVKPTTSSKSSTSIKPSTSVKPTTTAKPSSTIKRISSTKPSSTLKTSLKTTSTSKKVTSTIKPSSTFKTSVKPSSSSKKTSSSAKPSTTAKTTSRSTVKTTTTSKKTTSATLRTSIRTTAKQVAKTTSTSKKSSTTSSKPRTTMKTSTTSKRTSSVAKTTSCTSKWWAS